VESGTTQVSTGGFDEPATPPAAHQHQIYRAKGGPDSSRKIEVNGLEATAA